MDSINITNEENKPKVNLSNVREIQLPNGSKYIMYTDSKTNEPVMLKSLSDKSVKEQIEGLQNASISFNSSDSLYNTNGVLDTERKYTKEQLDIIHIENIFQYKHILDQMPFEKSRAILIFVRNSDKFNPKLKYLNLEEGIAIDASNNVISCEYNKNTNQFDVKVANAVAYQHEEVIESNYVETNIDNIDYDAIIDTIEDSNQPVEIEGYMIDMTTMQQYVNYPEIIERKEMAPKERMIWQRVLMAYQKKMEKRLVNIDKPKIKVLSNNRKDLKKAGFASELLTVSLAGFSVGVIFAAIVVIIKNIFFK